jgi:4-carboxymuconolactone decarboxylase
MVVAIAHTAEPSSTPAAQSASPSTARIGAPPESELNAAQRTEYESAIKGFGTPAGPRMPLLNSPDVLQAWGDMQKALSRSKLPAPLRELCIITVGAYWKSEFEWYVHAPGARKQGIPAEAIEAIRKQQAPHFSAPDQRIVYEFTHQLIHRHQVDDATYAAAWKLLGTRTLIDLIGLIGHYTSVSMMLNANHVPIPSKVTPAFGAASK